MKKIASILFLLLLIPSLCFATQNTKKVHTHTQKSVHKASHKKVAKHNATRKTIHKSKANSKLAHKKTKLKSHAHRKSARARTATHKRSSKKSIARRESDLDDLAINHYNFDNLASEDASFSSDLNHKMQGLLNYATSLVGTRYRFGGASPENGFDCSGYVRYVYKNQLGISLPHNAAAIGKIGTNISHSELRPGDLVLFSTWRQRLNHVGIYLGNNRFAHASSSRTGFVQISDIRNYYWAKRFRGARRVSNFS